MINKRKSSADMIEMKASEAVSADYDVCNIFSIFVNLRKAALHFSLARNKLIATFTNQVIYTSFKCV